MTGEPPGPGKKPHRLWPGLVVVAVLVLLAGLTGDLNGRGVLVFLALFVPPGLAAFLAAVVAARRQGDRQVIRMARGLCVLLTVGIVAAGTAGVSAWRGTWPGWELVGVLFFGSAAAGAAVAPFAAAYAVYRAARRLGKSYEEAQRDSRWDPDRFGE